MPIISLRIADFRNITSAELAPCLQGLNIICGDNGSGKTSLLEAIHYLGLGRSFRSSTAARLIKYETVKFSLFSQIVNDSQRYIPVGVERDTRGSSRLRMAEQDVSSVMELASLIPIRLINSQSHQLFESGPAFRRKYLDWGLFYQFESFLPCWRHFERALKQRNAVLRDRRPTKELDIWSNELIKHALELDKLRREYVALLTPFLREMQTALLPTLDLQINYEPGWSENMDYATNLANTYNDDLRIGHTQLGPHRADFDIQINGVSAKHFLSRGQQKLLICAMILAQGMLLNKHANKGLIYLVDDLPSELDLQGKQKLISLLSRQQTQIFITAIESSMICDLVSDKTDMPMKVFHVEHGSVVEMHG